MASPNMFRLYTTTVRHSPGHNASQGACAGDVEKGLLPA